MNNINFRPWVGDKYFSEGFKGKRILVLGLGHYCPDELSTKGRCFPTCLKENMREECFTQTEDVVEHFRDDYNGEKYLQTYLCFERAIYGRALTQEEREEFWNGIIFYNYLQYSAGSGSRVPISTEYWDKSADPFKEVLETYMPDRIIAWGIGELYANLPDWGGKASIIEIDGTALDVWIYTIKDKEIPVMVVYHPSTPVGKNWSRWHPFYKKFLNLPQL